MGVPMTATGITGSQATNAALNATAKLPGVFESGVFQAGVFETSGSVLPLHATGVQGSSFEAQPGKKSGRVVIQRPCWRISVDGSSVDDGLDTQQIRVSRSLGRSVQNGGVSLYQARGIRLPSLFNTLGAPSTGLDAIDFQLSYLRDDGVRILEPVMLNGLTDDQERDDAQAVRDTLAIADAASRYVNFPVSYQLAEGSGTPVRDVISALATAAGVTASSQDIPSLPGTVPMRKPIDLAKGDWLAVAQGILDVVGGRLLWDRSGVLTVRFDRPEMSVAPSVDWTFGPRDWVYSANGTVYGLQVSPAQTGYQKVIARGSRQILNNAGDGCGDETTLQLTQAESVHAPVPLAYHQGADGGPAPTFVYTATSIVAPAPVRMKTTEIKSWVTTRCGEVVSVRTKVWNFRNIEAARYLRTDAGVIFDLYSVHVDDNVDEGPVGNLYPIVQWGLAEEIVETFQFDSAGFLQKRVAETFRWYNPRRSYKERASRSVTWETSMANESYNDIGNGTAVTNILAQWLLVDRETETFDVENGYAMGREVKVEGYAAIPGSLFLYHNGEFGQRAETFQQLSRETEVWSHAGESLSNRLVTTYGIGDAFIGSNFESNLPQAPPSARRAAFAADGGNANRLQQQEIDAEVTAPILASFRPYRELDISVEWAESVEQLHAYARRLALTGMAPATTFHLPINPRLEEGHVVRLVGRDGQGVNVVGTVQDVDHFGPMAGPYLTRAMMLVYPDVSLVVN